jgi:hypothetical protein
VGFQMIRLVRTLALVIVAAACDARVDGAPSAGAVRADSAGVELIRIPLRPDQLHDVSVRADSVLRDSLGEPYLFTQLTPVNARTTPSGETAIAAPQEARVHLFDASGRAAGSLGARGGGPGEFRMPLTVLTHGDTLGVYDPQRLALQRWSGFGSTLLPQLTVSAELQGATMLALEGDRILLAVAIEDDVRRSTTLRWSSDTSPLLVAHQPAGRVVPLPCLPVPVRRAQLLAPQVRTASYADRVAIATGDGYRIHLFERGRLKRIITRVVPERLTDQRAIAIAAGRGLRASLGGTRCEITPARLSEIVGAAATVPPVNGLAITADGSTWVLRSLRSEKPPLVDQFDSTGAYVRTLRGVDVPIGVLPDGRLLVPIDDEDSGGLLAAMLRLPPGIGPGTARR